MNSTLDQEVRATALEQLAHLTTQFFLQADNTSHAGRFDLDPREGYVRLGQTKANGLLGSEIEEVRGLMNPRRELQAILSGRCGDSVFTISHQGRQISLSCCGASSLTRESLSLNEDGSIHYQCEESKAC